jgi:Na+/H+ antiporter NhaD/arsenite permease-like protein
MTPFMNEISVWPLSVSLLVFVATYAGVFLLRRSRATVAIVGAVAMVVAGVGLGFFEPEQAVSSVGFDTVTLLFGMMLLVSLLQETGYFEFLALWAAKAARGRPWLLLFLLGAVASVISALLDNVATIAILVPVTISLADILGISPTPYLMAEVLLANIGGSATLIGDPPNILIASAAGFSFLDFVTHLLPIVAVIWIVSQGAILLLFRRELMRSLPDRNALRAIEARRAITDPKSSRRMLIVLAGTMLLFFIHRLIGLEPGLVALAGACAGLLWVRPNFDRVLRQVHWDVLLYFVGLFVVVGGLAAAGALRPLGDALASLIDRAPHLAILAVLWGSAVAAGLVSNAPVAILLLPVFSQMAVDGVAVQPLWWALALGLGLGTNLTPLGSAAQVAASSLSEAVGERLTLRRWLHSGTVIGLVSCGLATLALVLAHHAGLL